jgi:hypothetical protein
MPNSIRNSCKSWWHTNGENGYCVPQPASTLPGIACRQSSNSIPPKTNWKRSSIHCYGSAPPLRSFQSEVVGFNCGAGKYPCPFLFGELR